MANPNSYSFGEANEDDDDDELEDLVAKQERPPIDFASIFKGEKPDETDSPKKSIGEIFGISDAKDGEQPELSAFDKIIGKTLEEDMENITNNEDGKTDTVVEATTAKESDEHSGSSEDTDDQAKESEFEFTPADAISSQTVYEGGHDFPLPGTDSSDMEVSASSDDSDRGEEKPAPAKTEIGRTESLPDDNALAPAQKQEIPLAETAPLIPNLSDEATTDKRAEVRSETVRPKIEKPNNEEAIADDDSTEDMPVANEQTSPNFIESSQEAERNVRQMMEDDDNDGNKPPGKGRNSSVEVPEPNRETPTVIPYSEVNKKEAKKESPAGTLALLLGAREIFKRRKGDKENRQERIKGDRRNQEELQELKDREDQRKRELRARQEKAQLDIDQLREIQNAAEADVSAVDQKAHIGVDKFDNKNISVDQDNSVVNQLNSSQIFEAPKDRENEIENWQSGERLITESDQEIEALERNSDQKLDAVNGQKLRAEGETLNMTQEADGELALDGRHEVSSARNVAVGSEYGTEEPSRATHISEVIADNNYNITSDASNKSATDKDHKDQKTTLLKNEELVSSIKAGVTIGLVIATLAAIFLIFR